MMPRTAVVCVILSLAIAAVDVGAQPAGETVIPPYGSLVLVNRRVAIYVGQGEILTLSSAGPMGLRMVEFAEFVGAAGTRLSVFTPKSYIVAVREICRELVYHYRPFALWRWLGKDDPFSLYISKLRLLGAPPPRAVPAALGGTPTGDATLLGGDPWTRDAAGVLRGPAGIPGWTRPVILVGNLRRPDFGTSWIAFNRFGHVVGLAMFHKEGEAIVVAPRCKEGAMDGGPPARNMARLSEGAKVVGVSSNYGGRSNSSTHGANNAIDGIPTTEWISNGDGEKAWIEIELARAFRLSAIGFWSRIVTRPEERRYEFEAQVEQFEVVADGKTTLGPFSVFNKAGRIEYFPVSVSATRLRFNVLKSRGSDTGAVEVGAYGPP
jgi:hypothetical protein